MIERYTNNDTILQIITSLKKKYPFYKITIVSEGKIEDFKDLELVCDDFLLNASIPVSIHTLVCAKVLVMAKSSFSYTSAILNENTIYYEDFWHKPLDNWLNIKDLTYDYIGNTSFRDIAKWLYCNRYGITFESEKINENDIVFLNLDLFNNFVNCLNNNKPKNKFILITFNSDLAFTEYHYNILKEFVVKIYSQNNTFYNSSIVKTIPIGFRSWPFDTINELKKVGKNKDTEKSILLYMNFVINTNYNKRTECLNTFINENWVTKNSRLSINLFYLDIKKSKYVLSPEGDGIDCHRIYECIYFDTIPILKTSLMDKFYETLPVIIVNSWEEITYDYLLDNYQACYNKLINWKKKNYLWLNPMFWLEY